MSRSSTIGFVSATAPVRQALMALAAVACVLTPARALALEAAPGSGTQVQPSAAMLDGASFAQMSLHAAPSPLRAASAAELAGANSAVPELSMASLLVAGALALAFMARRTRAQE